MESYEQKYREALGRMMKSLYGGLHGKTKEEAEKYFPELQESEDERIRKKLIEFFEDWGKRLSHCWGLSIPDILAWLEKQGQVKESPILQTCCTNGNSLTCKNDTLYDLLHKMPSYITVDGIFYHFILRKTALAYTAYYSGEEEGSGKIIFVMTSFSPIDLLNEMLEKLKKEGLLE